MTPTSPSPSGPLLSLPPELRLHILSFHLAASEIPIDIWTNTLQTTLPLTHLPTASASSLLAIFHTNRLLRREATALLATHVTLAFLPGPRSPFDRRWRTAGLPLPGLLRGGLARVRVDVGGLDGGGGGGSFLPLGELSGLREVRFQCHGVRGEGEGEDVTSVSGGAVEWSENDGEKKRWAVRGVEAVLRRHRWIRALVEGGAPWSCVFESVVLGPGKGEGGVRTVEWWFTVDPRALMVTGTRVVVRDALRLGG